MSNDHHNEPDDHGEHISGWHLSLGWGDANVSVAPYVPTPINVVKEMLKISKAGPGDILFDLGCGDGRILLTGVEEFNVDRAVGFELNSNMAEATRRKIENKDLSDRIKVVEGNFFKINISEATLITLYLTTSGNSKLKPKFIEELKKGTRIVSHDFPIIDWVTAKEDQSFYQFGSHKIFFYQIPQAFNDKPKIEASHEDRWVRLKRLFDRRDRV